MPAIKLENFLQCKDGKVLLSSKETIGIGESKSVLTLRKVHRHPIGILLGGPAQPI